MDIFVGDILRWEQQVRLRHMTTRKYLCIDATKEITLTDDNEDPKTVFRLYSVISVSFHVFIGKTVVLNFPSIRLAFCVPKAGERSQIRSAVIECKGTVYFLCIYE